MILKRIQTALILWAATSSCLLAATRYVSHSGSNTFPYTTWEMAANTIEAANLATLPGDTMLIDTGSFYLSARPFLQPNVTMRGKGMDSTTVLGADSLGVMFRPMDSVVVENIHFIGNGSYYAFLKYATEPNQSFFCHNCKYSNFASSILGFDDNREIEVRGCWFETWGNLSFALDLTGPGDYVIENNTFYAPGLWRSIGNFIGNYNGHMVFNSNVVVGCGPPGLNGVGGGGFEMKYNLFYGNSLLDEVVYGGNDFEVAFNSFYLELPITFNRADILTIVGTNLRRSHIYNNIFAGKKPRVIFYFNVPDSADIRINYNCFYSTEPMLEANIGIISGTGTIDSIYGNVYANPMYVDPWNGDLRLQKGSPCIDAGAPWILDPDGTRSDIGAFGGPDGEFYVYQDLPPQKPQKFDAWRSNGRVIVQWQKNTESDFLYYVLFRSQSPGISLDSANVRAYFTRDGKLIGGGHDSIKHLFPVGSIDTLPTKNLYTGYIPVYTESTLTQIWFTDDDITSVGDYFYVLVAVDSSLLVSEPTSELAVHGSELSVQAQDATLEHPEAVQNYPNPFNAVTAIVYNLPNLGAQPAPVRLTIFNSVGQRVRTLVNDRQMPGRHITYWNSDDDFGRQVASGIYFYRLEVSGIEFVKSGKMILMK